MDAASLQSTKSEINKLTSSHLEVQDPGQAVFSSRDNYSIRAGKAVPLQRNSERQIALTIPSARRGV